MTIAATKDGPIGVPCGTLIRDAPRLSQARPLNLDAANSIRVALLPDLLGEEIDWQRTTAVVVDVLRATSVMTTALAAGAFSILPVQDVEAARAAARALSAATDPSATAAGRRKVLLAGERQCHPVPGFDLGNSPSEYVGPRIAGAMIVLSTTNGTRAASATRFARTTLAASFLNVSAVTERLQSEANIVVVCSGTEGHVAAEDAWLAGCLVDRLSRSHWPANDAALLVAASWQRIADRVKDPQGLAEMFATTRGGHNLLQAGYRDDLAAVARIDALRHVPCRTASAAEFH